MKSATRNMSVQKLISENHKLADTARIQSSEIKRLRHMIAVLLEAREIEREFDPKNEIPF